MNTRRCCQSLVLFAGLSFAASQRNCSFDDLEDTVKEQLEMYDKDMFIDETCSSNDVPAHCNYMGIEQDCRGCYSTCEGAVHYKEDFPDEYSVMGDDLFYFCPGSGVDSIAACESTPSPVVDDDFTFDLDPDTTPPPVEVTPNPTPTPTGAPVTPSPTDTPVTPAPTDAPVTPAPTDAPVTPAPTDAPVTPAPTDAPVTPAPTDAPVTPAPTDAPVTPAPTEVTLTTMPVCPKNTSLSHDDQHCLARGEKCHANDECCKPFVCDMSSHCDKKHGGSHLPKPKPSMPMGSGGSYSYEFFDDQESQWNDWVNYSKPRRNETMTPEPTVFETVSPTDVPDLPFDATAEPTMAATAAEDNCASLLNDTMKAYLEETDKWVVFQNPCKGSHCNMFGIGMNCRGCYNSCTKVEAYYNALGMSVDDFGDLVIMCPAIYDVVDGEPQTYVSACVGRRRLRGRG